MSIGIMTGGAKSRTGDSVLLMKSTLNTLARLNRPTEHQEQEKPLSRPRRGGITRTELLPGRDRRRLGDLASIRGMYWRRYDVNGDCLDEPDEVEECWLLL